MQRVDDVVIGDGADEVVDGDPDQQQDEDAGSGADRRLRDWARSATRSRKRARRCRQSFVGRSRPGRSFVPVGCGRRHSLSLCHVIKRASTARPEHGRLRRPSGDCVAS